MPKFLSNNAILAHTAAPKARSKTYNKRLVKIKSGKVKISICFEQVARLDWKYLWNASDQVDHDLNQLYVVDFTCRNRSVRPAVIESCSPFYRKTSVVYH
jgi:hypothetical protein